MVPPTPLAFERSAVPGANLEDLDQDALMGFLAPRAGFDLTEDRLMLALGVAAQLGTKLLPTALGMLCFGRYPQLYRPEWGVVAVRLDGTHISDTVTAKAELGGTLIQQLEGALDFVQQETRSAADLAEDEGEYGLPVLREALVNALVHRDYRLTSRIMVRVFDQRVEVYSPGGPIVPIDSELAFGAGGISFSRNPMLMAVARQLGFAEQLGRGLPIIGRALAEHGKTAGLITTPNDVTIQIPSRLQELPNPGPRN